MPWILNTPIPSPHGDLTHVEVTSFVLDNKNKAMKINYEEGLVENGEFIPKRFKHYTVRDEPEVVNEITGETVSEATTNFTELALESWEGSPKTRYEEFKLLGYNELHDAGIIGDGVIE